MELDSLLAVARESKDRRQIAIALTTIRKMAERDMMNGIVWDEVYWIKFLVAARDLSGRKSEEDTDDGQLDMIAGIVANNHSILQAMPSVLGVYLLHDTFSFDIAYALVKHTSDDMIKYLESSLQGRELSRLNAMLHPDV